MCNEQLRRGASSEDLIRMTDYVRCLSWPASPGTPCALACWRVGLGPRWPWPCLISHLVRRSQLDWKTPPDPIQALLAIQAR
jgi:hypothetical protein